MLRVVVALVAAIAVTAAVCPPALTPDWPAALLVLAALFAAVSVRENVLAHRQRREALGRAAVAAARADALDRELAAVKATLASARGANVELALDRLAARRDLLLAHDDLECAGDRLTAAAREARSLTHRLEHAEQSVRDATAARVADHVTIESLRAELAAERTARLDADDRTRTATARLILAAWRLDQVRRAVTRPADLDETVLAVAGTAAVLAGHDTLPDPVPHPPARETP